MVDESLVTLQRAWQMSTRQAHLPAVEQRLQAAAGLALTRPARTALLHLSEAGPLHVSDLAAAAGVDVSTMSRTLRQLGASGFIAREQGEDLRAVRISLNRAGEEAVGQLLAAGQVILREVLSGWSEADRDALSRLLVRFADDFAVYLRESSKQNWEREVEPCL
jgi:DNA-binding MarR family transcriptional regulator